MANPTTYFGWVMPNSADLVTDLPADFNVFGQGVDTSMQDLLGGTTGQVLSKTSGTNMDFTWVTPTDQTPLTTKGDLFTFTTVDARIGVGANGTILTADSAEATGLKWATPTTASFVGCAVNITTNQTLTNGATTVVDFANEVFDTNGFHSNVTNPSRITIPAGYAGKYLINGGSIIGDKTTGRMIGVISLNGSLILQTNWGNNSSQSGGEVNGVLNLAVSDYITFAVYQASGSDAVTGTDGKYNRFSAIYLGA